MKVLDRAKALKSSKRGSITFTTMCVLLCLLIFSSFIWSYTGIITNLREVQDQTTLSLRAVMASELLTKNKRVIERKGLSAVNTIPFSDAFLEDFLKNMPLTPLDNGEGYARYDAAGRLLYSISDPNFTFETSDGSDVAYAVATWRVQVPLYLAGSEERRMTLNTGRKVLVVMNKEGTADRGDEAIETTAQEAS